ncbi:Protein of unknown function DUF86, Caur_2869 group [hydrothermal vent metagenome]|uniref:Nucleotidyltransferase n=1 Tax=hydrothermal vent metagenome TaxID=652676 RepID=A0A3B1DG82_9ZZZZ
MERINLKYNDATKALETLEEILTHEFSIVVRDATIQRFEYTFEAIWKFLKEYLKEKEGVIANTPKAVFRAIFSSGFLTEDETVLCLTMTDRRNDTSHTYKEAVSELIYEDIPDYVHLMKNLLNKFKDKV